MLPDLCKAFDKTSTYFDGLFQLPQSLLQRSTRTGNIQPHKPFTFFAERRSFIQSQVGIFYKQAIQFLLI